MSKRPNSEDLSRTGHKPGLGWVEQFLGGSPESELAFLKQAMDDINLVQRRNKKTGGAKTEARAFHAKIHAGIDNAEYVVMDNIPYELQGGILVPGARYRTDVRLSSASGLIQPDTKGDLRGLAARVNTDLGPQDFLGTNAEQSHARNARQFVEFAKAASGSKALMFPRLIGNLGLSETVRMMRTVIGQVKRPIESLVTESYFSRSAYAFGDLAVKFKFTPNSSFSNKSEPSDSFLRDDLVIRLQKAPVVFDFQVQYFLNEAETPIEDGYALWASLPFTIAQLVLPQQDLLCQSARASSANVEDIEFNPWRTTKTIRPLGSLNRARRSVYPASVRLRKGR
ncbi:MAG: hypothetical protein SGJ27_07260 [Candidatus Melainabacteria bacterium]|nr:hypothetical protein [Candidatus Melainabacteria bacterium]